MSILAIKVFANNRPAEFAETQNIATATLLLLNKKFFLVGQKKLKTFKNKTYTKVLKTFRIM